MTTTPAITPAASRFNLVLTAAAKLPGVRINRESYLRAALRSHCTEEELLKAIEVGPAAAGLSRDAIDRMAKESIRYETAKVTTLSAAAGIPGGFAMLGTVPADLAQYFGHMLRISQKLAYLYGWPELLENEAEEIDDATQSILTLFVGVMAGAQVANSGLAKVSQMMAAQAVRRLPQQALTKGVVYPVVKKVAQFVGVRMTKQIFAGGVAKAIPIIGAGLSGGLTLATFLPMSHRLRKHLASLDKHAHSESGATSG